MLLDEVRPPTAPDKGKRIWNSVSRTTQIVQQTSVRHRMFVWGVVSTTGNNLGHSTKVGWREGVTNDVDEC